MSQRMLAVQLQLRGIDLDKNAIHRIENGKRFVRDMELKVFAEILHTTLTDLMQDDSQNILEKNGGTGNPSPTILPEGLGTFVGAGSPGPHETPERSGKNGGTGNPSPTILPEGFGDICRGRVPRPA